MLKKILKKWLFKLRKLFGLEEIRLLLGRLLSQVNSKMDSLDIADYEFKVYSQWGEDGIIQHLIKKIEIPNKIFVEFGVQDYTESNTRFLLINDNWSGLVIDASLANINFIKEDEIYWRHELKAICSFITRNNINKLISENIDQKDIGILSIDIDGNDYWIWEAINALNPRIVICEYNSLFGAEHAIVVPYEEKFNRAKKHYSHLYYGASLPALNELAQKKGYVLAGCNCAGNNAFFIRKDISWFQPVSVKKCFVCAKFREARDKSGKLVYSSPAERLKTISEMEVYDLRSAKTVRINEALKS